jgi:hypothetical protein
MASGQRSSAAFRDRAKSTSLILTFTWAVRLNLWGGIRDAILCLLLYICAMQT